MRRTHTLAAGSALALTLAGLGAGGSALGATNSPAPAAERNDPGSYVVLARAGQDATAIAGQLAAAGATVTDINTDIGMITLDTEASDFVAKASATSGVEGVARNRKIGQSPEVKGKPNPVEREHHGTARAGGDGARESAYRGDPLDRYLWGMDQIKAAAAHRVTLGDKRVRVGVLDTGIDGTHPDLAANFDRSLSRNFTTDMPQIDGPCEYASCKDPNNVDNDGHGTHVAGTIAAAKDGFGLSGVAPKVTLVNIRGGQDSGYFFLSPVANALTYAGNAGLDVVNMSFYVDPWAYNCLGGAPEDSAAEAREQETIIKVMNRALNYANDHNVTLVAAAGNGHEDLAKPRVDTSSPDFGGAPHPRTIINKRCFDLPVEGPHVLGVTSLGPSGKKSDFSNYTTAVYADEVEFAAPGGWYRDGYGTANFMTNENMILSSAPKEVLQATGEVDGKGNVTPLGMENGVKKQCRSNAPAGADRCGYYQWLQGTSMASPHATGVAALAVSAHGRGSADGKTMKPGSVRWLMARTATDHACPAGGVQSYENEGRDDSYTAICKGTTDRNGFYGYGIVNAAGVVR
mgnify:CR=1 FL=1